MHLLDAEAWCTDCDWKTEGKNAMGNAARHHKSTQHFTMVSLYYSQTFGEPHQEYLKKPLQGQGD